MGKNEKNQVVLFEFLGDEPLDNVITCLNYKIDQVVYFGYQEDYLKQEKALRRFLRQYCGVNDVSFHLISHHDLQSVLNSIRKILEVCIEEGKDIYCDITGGESLILVAFGMLEKEYQLPIHLFDIPKGKLIELDEGADRVISRDVERQTIKLTLDMLIEMSGGVINYNRQKSIKHDLDDEFSRDVDLIWEVAKNYSAQWNYFSDVCRKHLVFNGEVERIDYSSIVLSSKWERNLTDFISLVKHLASEQLITGFRQTKKSLEFSFKTPKVKACILGGGSILELVTYKRELKHSSECLVGVHIDWDGEIHGQYGSDVLNEIDVLSLKGYQPTFISCKSGKMSSDVTLHALYELDTVANRFAGKYARKVLVTMNDIRENNHVRAKEMGIEVKVVNN